MKYFPSKGGSLPVNSYNQNAYEEPFPMSLESKALFCAHAKYTLVSGSIKKPDRPSFGVRNTCPVAEEGSLTKKLTTSARAIREPK